MSTAPKYPIILTVTELKLADVVELFDGPFGTAVVTQITEDEVVLHRPYGVTGDFSYTGGVPYSVGNEVCKYIRPGTVNKFKVWQRKELK